MNDRGHGADSGAYIGDMRVKVTLLLPPTRLRKARLHRYGH
jgi:hypothetical protein